MDSNVSNKLAWLLRSLSRSLFTPTPATTTRASFRSFTKWGTDRIARRGVMVLRPAAATCRSKHSSPPGLVICTRCTLGLEPFFVSGLCSTSNPTSRSDDGAETRFASEESLPLKKTRRTSWSIAFEVYATVTRGVAGKGEPCSDVASVQKRFVARAAARSARRIAADMTPSRAPPAVISVFRIERGRS